MVANQPSAMLARPPADGAAGPAAEPETTPDGEGVGQVAEPDGDGAGRDGTDGGSGVGGSDGGVCEAVAGLAVVGADLRVPLVTGELVPYVNLDYAASAPCLTAVRDAVDAALPWYSSVHRGAGFASQVTTRAYERARESVRRFVGARDTAAVVFTRNTTDAMNLLAHALPRGTTVLVYETEHHASLLPWLGGNSGQAGHAGQSGQDGQDGRSERPGQPGPPSFTDPPNPPNLPGRAQWSGRAGRSVVRLPAPRDPGQAVSQLAAALRDSPVGPRLVCVTGASNVTGELWPVAEIVETAHAHGARVVVDAAQLAPHRRIDMRALDVDYLALSGHKLYAPFGAGALVGRGDWLRAAPPYLAGGGATRRVLDTSVVWNELPERHEAGTPNVLGAVALAAACDTLGAAGLDALAAREGALLARLRDGLTALPGVRELALWGPRHPRIGVVSFTVDGWDTALFAAALSAEYGIGVRDGAFCAHPFLRRLVGREPATALRASTGIGTTDEHVSRFLAATAELIESGPRWSYADCDGRPGPNPDPRRWP